MELSKRYESILVSILFVAWGSVTLDRTTALYLAPYFAPQFHLNNTQIGMLASGISITWAISSLLLAALSDRVGRRTLLIPTLLIFSIFSWSAGLAQNFDQLLAVRMLMGLAGGGFFSIMSAVIEESSHPTRRGRNVGIVISAAALVGLAVSPVLVTQIATHFNWRWAFFVASVPGFVMGLAIWKFVKEPERRIEGGAHGHGHVKLADYFQILRYRNIWLVCLASIGTITWLFVQNVFAPMYITRVAHQPPTTAGFLLGASGLGSFVLGFIFPAVSDRLGRKETLLILAPLSTLVPIALLVPSLYHHLWLLSAILFVTNGHVAIISLVLILVPTESVPRAMAATAIGLSVLVGELVGATILPTVAGAMAERYGLGITLWISAAGTVLVFFVSLFLKRTGPSEPGAAAHDTAIAG